MIGVARSKAQRARAAQTASRSRRSIPGGGLRRGTILVLALATAATACAPPPTSNKITARASSATITYGDEIPEVTVAYSPSLSPTTPATCTTTATADSPVGTYPTVCEGAEAEGKTFTYVEGTITIEPAPLTVTASSASIVLGDAIPGVTATYDGLVKGEAGPAVLATCSTDATAASPAGTYASTCAGASDDNYEITYVEGAVEIAPAPVTVTASSGGMVYGQDPPEISANYVGLQLGDTAPAVEAVCVAGADASSPVGTYASTCSGAADPNYVFTYVAGAIEVSPAPAIVTASSAVVPAGSTIPEITASYSGLVGDDVAPAVEPVCSTTATSSSAPGTYPSSCSGAADPNYSFGYVDGTVQITDVSIPTVVVTASSATITYDDAVPAVTASYDGLTGGLSVPTTAATCTTTAVATSGAGLYPTTCSGAAESGHDFTYVAGVLTILPAPATVTASSHTAVYGAPIPAITASYSGLVHGDTAPATAATCSTSAVAGSAVGDHPTQCSGAEDPNYTFGYAAGTLSITKAPATVTASSAEMTEGAAVPTITATYGGLLFDQVVPATPATCSTNATSQSPAGSYDSTCAGADDPNHEFTYVPGVVTVTAAAIPTGYAGYSTLTKATTLAAAMDGLTLPRSTIDVASTAGFEAYTNLTIPTSNGAQAVFCTSISSATRFGGCTGGTGTMATGNHVTTGSPNRFDVYTIMGGAAAVSPSSLVILEDVPAAYRGMSSTVTANATHGIVTVLPTPAATGVFSLTFGICDAGTATYDAGSPACHTGRIEYGPGAVSTMGAKVQVSIASSNVYQKLSTWVSSPDTVSQGETFTLYAAAAGSSVPSKQPSSIGDATVVNANSFAIIFPIPAGMQFQSAQAIGGDANTSGKMDIRYCTATGTGCTAKLSGNYDATTLPYVQVTLPGVTVPGGSNLTMPTVGLTLTATGAVGTQANATLTEFLLTTRINAPIIGGANAVFDGYPTTGNNTSITPPKAPPAILRTIEITA